MVRTTAIRRTLTAFASIRGLALGYIALAAVIFFASASSAWSYSYRQARTRAEQNQVQWILLASLIASVLIAYLLWQAWNDPATLGRDNAAWPMFGVSLLYTMAYAFSITRYKLMQVEEIINRSVVYFALQRDGRADLLGGAPGQRLADRRSAVLAHADVVGAMVAAISVIVVLILSEVARGRFQRVIDRRFFREKYKFDEAMQKMRLAVGSLVDRITLGRRLLEGGRRRSCVWSGGRSTCCEASGDGVPPGGLPRPDARRAGRWPRTIRWWLRLRQTPAVRLSHAMALGGGVGPGHRRHDRAGGRGGHRPGGRRRCSPGCWSSAPSGAACPTRTRRWRSSGRSARWRPWSLHSADIQQTLESLNQELRDKVDKIAEQQRRILILQEQLRDRAERDREGAAHADEPGALPRDRPTADGDSGGLRRDQGVRARPSAG